MDIKSILTEAEFGTVSGEIVSKLESAFRAELAAAVERETAKSKVRFNKLLESVSQKADAKIDQAIQENLSKMSTNAMADKMYKVLQNISTLLENAGIPASEATKKLREELAQCDVNLKRAYAEREHVKQQLNEQEKKNFIYREVQGMKPEVVDAVMQHFIHFDIREIDREAIMKFIDGTSNDTFMMDVDQDAGGELNMDRVTAALSDIDRDLEIDVPNLPSRNKKPATGRFESLGKGLRSERVAKATPNVTFESLANIGSFDMDEQENVDDDVAAAISQFKTLDNFGGFA